MKSTRTHIAALLFLVAALIAPVTAPAGLAQSLGTAGTIEGAVADTNGAVIAGAAVTIESVTGYKRTTITDQAGAFRFDNVLSNNYQLTVSATGFKTSRQGISVRSAVPLSLNIALSISGVEETVTVE